MTWIQLNVYDIRGSGFACKHDSKEIRNSNSKYSTPASNVGA